MHTRLTAAVVGLTAVAAVTLSACSSNATTSAADTSGGSTSSAASSGSKPSLTIMVGGMSKQIYLPFMLTKQLGYYDKAGVNVSLQDEGAGVDATTQMVAGQVQGTGGFYDHTIALQGSGKFAECVVSMLQVRGEVELCRADIKG